MNAPCRLSVLAAALLAAAGACAAPHDSDKLPATRVQDLQYGDVLFHYFQQDDFEALTRLGAYQHWNQLPHHQLESQLLLASLYLSLGLYNEAADRFQKLLTADVPVAVRNRAWFYLGQIWYDRGYLDRAVQALRRVQGPLPTQQEAQRVHLLANALLRQGHYDEAIALLKDWSGPPDWTAYARFNLGVALVHEKRLPEAASFLTAVGTLQSSREELLALRDRANLALGFAYLQAGQPKLARVPLARVRLNGASSDKALLGMGWADSTLGDYQAALVPWVELQHRSLLDSAVQESYLAVPYAYGKLGSNTRAAAGYETALASFAAEQHNLDDAIARIRSGGLLRGLLEDDQQSDYGWSWQLQSLPDRPESRYLYAVLADHDFQEGLKNYRDLRFLGATLADWQQSTAAFGDMIDTRERAYAQRLPRVDRLLSSGAVERLQQRRNELASRLDAIEARQDVAALGTPEERERWAQIRAIEAALAGAPANAVNDDLRERLRLVKGVLYYRLNAAFKARLRQERRTIKDLDVALQETRSRWIRVDSARRSVPTNTGAFVARLTGLQQRLTLLQGRLALTEKRQDEYLRQLAIAELAAQKERLDSYVVQARFALATIYDKAADAGSPASAPAQPPAPAAAPAAAPSAGQVPATRAHSP